MELSAKEARLFLSLLDERLAKAADPLMLTELHKAKSRVESYLKSINEL
jgi:hypothetical protein